MSRPQVGNDVFKLCDVAEKLFDPKTDGLWVLHIDKQIEAYTKKFRKTLGYEGETDFPSLPSSWQNAIDPNDKQKALEAYEFHKLDTSVPYYLPVTYNRKDGSKVHLICAGAIVNRKDPEDEWIMLGTHKVIKI